MRHWIAGACAGLMLACSAFAQEGQQAAPAKKAVPSKQANTSWPETDLNLLLEGNIRAMWAAFRDKKKQDFDKYLWDDYRAVEEDAQGERNKLRVLREVDENAVHDFKLQSFLVETLGLDAMLVTYENVITFPPKSVVHFEKIFISEIWIKRNGQWKAWRYQATRVK